jgi:hypothetical protein
LGRSTAAVLVVLFKVNVHSLLLVQKRMNQEKRHRQAASCPALCRFGGSFEVRLRLTSALYPPALDSRVLSAEPVRLKPALLRMPEGQNRGAECFAVLEFEGVLGRKIQIICDGYIGGDLPQVWSEAKVLNRLYRMFCGA